MKYDDYVNFLDLIKSFSQGLDMDLSTSTYFFDSSDSNSFQEEYQILKMINELINKIKNLMEKIKE